MVKRLYGVPEIAKMGGVSYLLAYRVARRQPARPGLFAGKRRILVFSRAEAERIARLAKARRGMRGKRGPGRKPKR